MRFISRLFNRGPRRDDWLKISTEITRGFEADAKNFFQSVVRSIDECPPEARGSDGLRPVHRILGGNAEIAIKAYELSALSGLLDVMEYVPRAQGRDFCDLLFGQVCGSALSDILGRMHIEDSLNKDARAARFSGDITRYALDREMDSSGCIFVAMVIVPMLEPVLQCQVGMTVAHAFGDALNFQSLKKQAQTLLEHLQTGRDTR